VIDFSPSQQAKVTAVGQISLTKPRLHIDQVASVHYLIYVVNGTFHVSEDGQSYKVQSNQIFFRELGKHHYSHTYMAPGTTWFWVAFTLPVPNKTDETFTLPKLMTLRDHQKYFHTLEEMVRLHQSANPYKGPHLSCLLSSFFYKILAEPKDHPTGDEELVLKVNSLLGTMLNQKFSSNIISKQLNLDYSYIGKRYKATTGTTINQYFNHLKIQRAIKMMEEGSDNMTLISQALGYPNPFYFSRIFKKNTGLSPRDYLKQIY